MKIIIPCGAKEISSHSSLMNEQFMQYGKNMGGENVLLFYILLIINSDCSSNNSPQYWPAQPDNPLTIRVASLITFSVCLSVLCSLCVCSLFSVTFFLYCSIIYCRHTADCNVCDPEFALRVNLRRHNPSMQTATYVMLILQ